MPVFVVVIVVVHVSTTPLLSRGLTCLSVTHDNDDNTDNQNYFILNLQNLSNLGAFL